MKLVKPVLILYNELIGGVGMRVSVDVIVCSLCACMDMHTCVRVCVCVCACMACHELSVGDDSTSNFITVSLT